MTIVGWQCPRCGEFCKTKNSQALHLLTDERCFKTGEDIADALRHSIYSRMGQVDYLIRLIPATRGDPVLLENWHKVIFQRTKYYDYGVHLFFEKEGQQVHGKQIRQDSLDRCRRKLQETDEKLYHDKETRMPLVEHDCIQSSEQTQLKREILQEEHRRIWPKV